MTIGRLRAERTWLIASLRSAPAETFPPPAPAVRVEATRHSVQTTLLSLGLLLLVVAGLVLAAVTYGRLGAGGRAAALLALTVATGYAARPLLARGLTASAETTTALALALSMLCAAGLRSLGLADGSDPLAFSAVTCGVLGVAAVAYGRALPVRTAPIAALLLLHVSALLTAAALHASDGAVALTLLALCAADLLLQRRQVLVPKSALAACLSAGWALLVAIPTAYAHDPLSQVALLAAAALAAVAAMTWPTAATACTPLVALAAWTAAGSDLTLGEQAVLVAGIALAGALMARALPPGRRAAATLGALGTAAAAALTLAEHVAELLALPVTWLGAPWTRTSSTARGALSPDQVWTGSSVALAVLAIVALVLVVVDLRVGAAGAAVLLVLLVPVGLDAPYAVAIAVGLALTIGLTVLGLLRHRVALAAAALTGLHVLVWSAADETATLTVAGLLALLCAVAATRTDEPVAPALAGALLALEIGALGAAGDLTTPQAGGLLLLAVAALAAVSPCLSRLRAQGSDVAAVATGGAALLLTSGDAAWLSAALGALGLLALATALRPDRRPAAIAGALLLAASSWVRLAEAGVQAPEPYVVPLGLLALGLGHLRRREVPATRSFAAYGSGLSLLLVPSLLAVDSGGLQRPLLLGLTALVVLLIGARSRLQAPLAMGGAVLALDALHLLAPYAADLPRWVPLAVVGAVLVVLGTTYEQRGRDLALARQRYDAMA